ncbi:hypothetical protein CBS115989_5975 [Aspergillus niger]|uniref:Box C/D snoRNA protein 1 n=1 Tax=Aspergillus niger ATCC 13496 TaxID=1353008 RepID=A0A370CEL1_ASPNG|nr:HIT finger domain protein [Aspergillus niger CBS 513.88]KAI2817527.1 hypothetical protein CBS115989_5975 [Aspergillus niger]KAI2856860.1 hypothetical protein CBS11232_3576 [Aspergillus niger]KAI2877483.1 hypothetical protein CBS115988_3919 [Aspergillus niger]RDH25631.1 HIT finger domain protein [Aspergillus niger ATCC 13496]|eukprot:XP_001401169.2 HIT finger domain protein [Aspergillus niger CBS 513.88]
MSTSTPDSPLSDLCSICHLQPPKYRCPRCSTRTCSLPCTRRHKLWSQCSGVRDPAAYLRRSELATESAFDRDFNFITGIERSIERAGRDAENRGIDVASEVRDLEAVGLDSEDTEGVAAMGKKGGAGAGGKRKRGDGGAGGGTRAEMEFLRRAEERGVKVVRAPKGMSRNKGNGSRWLGRNQCLVWTVEWILSDGEKRMRNCSETAPVADSYDRVVPVPKEEGSDEQGQKQTGDEKPEGTSELKTEEQQPQDAPSTTAPEPASTTEPTQPTDAPTAQPEASNATPITSDSLPLTPHRDLYFYLHRPRTATKQPVLAPLPPKISLAAALRDHIVLEFPTIYVLPDSPDTIRAQEDAKYILEEEYLRTHQSPEESSDDTGDADDAQLPPGAIDLRGVDESKVLEVLQKDLFEPSAAA